MKRKKLSYHNGWEWLRAFQLTATKKRKNMNEFFENLVKKKFPEDLKMESV